MSKTPVSMLQEHCARQGTVPQYDLVINGVGTHEPHFQYRLTVCDVVTVGDGKSKKEAKHEAARKAINILLPHSKEVKQEKATSFNNINLSEEPCDEFFSPYQHVVKENYVGNLATVSASKSLPDPKYVFVGEVGLPHAKTFTYECHVANIIECASARTKQQAKHLSALNMIERLSKVFGDLMLDIKSDISNENLDEASKEAEKVICKMGTKRIGEPLKNHVRDYQYFDINAFFDNSPLLNDLLGYSKDRDENSFDPSELLAKLFDSCGKNVIFTSMPSKTQFLCTCQMNSAPYFVTVGQGLSHSEAQQKAAHNLLYLLKSFM